jgi:hypothetical protein
MTPVIVTHSRARVTYATSEPSTTKPNKTHFYSVSISKVGEEVDSRHTAQTRSAVEPLRIKKCTTSPRLNFASLPEEARTLLLAAMRSEHRAEVLADKAPDRECRGRPAGYYERMAQFDYDRAVARGEDDYLAYAQQ